MRIVHITPTLEVEAGGLSEAVKQMAVRQTARGHDITVVTPQGKEGKMTKNSPVEVVSIPVRWAGWGAPVGMEALFQRLHPEQLHLHGVWEPFLHAVARWGIQHGVRTGWTPHGMEAVWHQSHHRLLKACFRWIHRYRYSWENANWIQALNEEEERCWSARTRGAVIRIPNGTEYQAPQGPVPEWLARLQGKRILIFLGRLHPQKAPDVAVGAFLRIAEAYPDTVLVMAGADGGMLENLKQLVHSHPAADRVVFAGWVAGEAKAHLLSQSCLCVHPSQSEGHSLALLEAAAYGLPVLMSERAGFGELIEAEGAVSFFPTVESCAEQLLHLLGDSAGLNRMGQKGRRLVQESYSWEASVESLLRLYAE